MSDGNFTVAVDLSTPNASVESTVLVRRPGAGESVRITAPDLREAQKKRSSIRAGFDEYGTGGRVDVLLDVLVHIAADARTARREAVGGHRGDTVVYVGTPCGLASLILDIRAADVADGVTVVPAVAEGSARDSCVQLLLGDVLPILEARGLAPDATVRPHAG
jgi:alkanesulfonate monooxygenase SsuD/methylene tetrahydromethanopterin reductase-like flavin-dependent oxidoreductase (luciferase family)